MRQPLTNMGYLLLFSIYFHTNAYANFLALILFCIQLFPIFDWLCLRGANKEGEVL